MLRKNVLIISIILAVIITIPVIYFSLSHKKTSCYLILNSKSLNTELWKYIRISSTRHHHQFLGNYKNITEAQIASKEIKCSLVD